MRIRIRIKRPQIKINPIIQTLILSDVALVSGFGFITPIFAIFITNNIQGGTVEVAGYASAIYWIVMSLTVVFFGRYLDKNHGEKDDFWFIIIGNILAALATYGYLISELPWHIYLFQGFYAMGMSMNIAAYAAIFTRHIDKGAEAFDWSIRSAIVGIGAGVTGALGGIIVGHWGFNVLFSIVIGFVIFSAILPFLIYYQLCPPPIKSDPKDWKDFKIQ